MNFSVIIPCYNVEIYLENCLNSLIQTNYTNYEIILINDGSTDGTKKICEKYAASYNFVKLINQENKGVGFARNLGIENAIGKYICFFDPDDIIVGNPFVMLENYINDDFNLIMLDYYDVLRKRVVKREYGLYGEINKEEFKRKILYLINTDMMYTIWNKVYKREFLIKYRVRFDDTPMGQDVLFNLKIYKLVTKIMIINEAYYHYFQYREGSSTNKLRENRYLFQLNELEKISNLLNFFGVDTKNFIFTRKARILIEAFENIAGSGIKRNKKIKLLNKISKNSNFADILVRNKNNKKTYFSIFLVRKKLYTMYLLYFKLKKLKRKFL